MIFTMKDIVLKIGIGLLILGYIITDESEKQDNPQVKTIYKETIYIVEPSYHEERGEHIDWLFPPGNQRLNIPPGSGLEREWQNQKRKTYKPDYELIPVETNY